MPFHSSSRLACRHWNDQPVPEALMVPLLMIMRHESQTAFLSESSPKKIIRSRQPSLILRTNLSA